MDLPTWEILTYFLVTLIASVFSGITGGGAGFINTPLLILFGLSPAQAVATGKFTGLATAAGSVTGLRGVQKRSKKELYTIMGLAVVVGLFVPHIITNLNGDIYRKLLGVILLAMIPILLFKKVGQTQAKPSPTQHAVGYGLLIGALTLQGIFSAGMGSLVNVVLMMTMGMTALEANVTKRYAQLALNTLIVLGVMFSGFIIWQLAVAGAVGALIGSFIGGKIAVKKGDTFVMSVFVVIMLLSGLAMLFG